MARYFRNIIMSLHRVENPPIKQHFVMEFACKRSIRILSIGIRYSMRDLICDVVIAITVLQAST